MSVSWKESGTKRIDVSESEAMWYMKAVAVIAIVACHCTHVSENAGLINQLTTKFFDYWISYGVPIFYFIAGFFMHVDNTRESRMYFWKSKLKSIIIPWICTGTAVWLYIVIRKGGASLEYWARYLFLRESYLYFLTDLLGFYILFFALYKKKNWMIGIGVLWIIIAVYGEMYQVSWMISNVARVDFPIVNLGLFYAGIITRKHMLQRYFCDVKWGCMIIPFIIIRYTQLYIWKTSAGIFVNMGGCLCIIIALYSTCYRLTETGYKCLKKLGKNSFAIYLLHMPFAGLVANVMNRSESFAVLTLWRPIIVIGMTMIAIHLYEIVVGRKRKWLMLIGVR